MKAQEIRFGVEIECYIPNAMARTNFVPGGYHRGNQIHLAPRGWNSQHDGSLCDCPPGYTPAEVVSPILKGEDGLAQIWYMCEYLQRIDAIVNSTCGLHVHVDARGLTPEEIEIVKGEFRKFEMAFYGLSGRDAPNRWTNHYCQNSDHWQFGNRYQSLNLTNLGNSKNTIEVRCWAGTLLAEVIVSAVYMIVAMVSRVSEGHITYNTMGTRIANAFESAQGFCQEYLTNPTHWIVADVVPDDVVEVILHQCDAARPMLARLAV